MSPQTQNTGPEVNEYEREPVPASAQKGWRSFLGMYAGEHTAGTEFVIGPLFVAHGVGAFDFFAGLILGNILAVLSWGLMTAPIATSKRMTLYYQLERICGYKMVSIYNVVNALMFCFLAGSMIAVSATAVGIPFNLTMPTLTTWLPTSLGWVLVVLVIGFLTTLVAIKGYNQVARFANVAAPWMILIFLSAALAILPELGVTRFSEFWAVANKVIWTGIPLEGVSKFSFWHVLFFAWFCNMAMHIGMSDLTILRYAKSWKYGFHSFSGMFIGHFIAWISSGILYAAFLQSSNFSTEFAPGPIAYGAAGVAGAVCVVVAGWSTANPTIYRAGLALQGVLPKMKTWKVTAWVGAVTTIAACFPALVMKLLDFVALYGLVLMPMGAVIFADFYLSPRFGITQEMAYNRNISFSNATFFTWLITLGICLGLNLGFGIDIFFLGLPGWFIAVFTFLILSKTLYPKGKEALV